MSEAMNKHPDADVMVNFASLRSAYDATLEALQFPQVSLQSDFSVGAQFFQTVFALARIFTYISITQDTFNAGAENTGLLMASFCY